ncbi:MAG: hypothetical protein FWE08_00370 [Oscillospiraceae bacterium]|nr:hypothetical protein [Oscillospiraceae bacterium]
MKRLLKIGICLYLIAVMLSASFALGASANGSYPQENAEPSALEELLVGTWRWETSDSWLIMFRPDGTGVDGPPGLRTRFVWHVENDRLFIDGTDYNIRIHGDTITLDRFFSRTSYTYIRHSDETDLATSFWLFIVLGPVFIGLPALIIVLVVRAVRRRKRRRESLGQEHHF